MSVQRGAIHRTGPSGREFMVISIDAINDSGSVILVEVADESPEWTGPRHLLSVPLGSDRLALAWRVNWMRAERLGERTGEVGQEVVDRVVATLKAAIEP